MIKNKTFDALECIGVSNKSITTAFKRLPMDIVNHILPYDIRFVLRNGKIIQKLDMNKYKALNLLLLIRKPTIVREISYNIVTFWSYVSFSNGKGIYYSIGRDWCKNHLKDHVVYSYGNTTRLMHEYGIMINYPVK